MNGTLGRDTPHLIRLLVDHVPAMLAYWDRDLRCRFANRAYERWFGVDPDSLIGTSIRDLLGPQLFALNEPYIRAALRGEEQLFERVVPGADGVKRFSLATYVPDIVDGEVLGFIAHVTEVTKLKEIEAALRAEAVQREIALAKLRESRDALVDAQRLGRVGNWEWEVPSDSTVWSEELYRIFGLDSTQPPPSFAEQSGLYRHESWEQLQAAVSTTLRTGDPYVLELDYVRADGQAGWIESRGEAVRGESGEIGKLRGTVLETTQRHHMEEIRLKVQTAEAASRNKTQLLSRVSHELRTPLNAILGFSQLCEMDEILDPKHRLWATSIAGAGRHMLDVVEEVLDLAAADSGRIVVQDVDVALNAILKDSLALASRAAVASGIDLHGDGLDWAPIPVRGDAKRLKQVIDNLLSNAIKYSLSGGRVSVAVSAVGSHVEVSVKDCGPGLSSEQLERMFVPFDRLGAEMTAIPGTGLGLALAKTLVGLMGGTLRVETVLGAGSTFTMSLRKGSSGG
jgi:PAS domain S-box-containing protein